ncbi:GntR family transcriptional regulator [Streptomyces yerevanensis]|uniref:GntR family transcriptional regulator n=1 Tax=Streptomyces yerevanensis TaxID=66378 RepID=UPI000D1225C3|nr:GntR family transcriptional regulator [Streptomyces yerevanensis]
MSTEASRWPMAADVPEPVQTTPGYVITYAQFLAHYSGVRPELLQQAVAGAVADGVLERSGDALWATDPRWSRIPVAYLLTMTTVAQDVVRRRVALGVYGPGDPLPVEELAADFEVSAARLVEPLGPFSPLLT